MMDPERAAILLAKYVAGELSPAESEELDLAFRDNPGLRQSLQVLQGLHVVPPGLRAGEEAEMLERGLSKFRARRSDLSLPEAEDLVVQKEEAPVPVIGKLRHMNLSRWMAAACVLIAAVTGVLYVQTAKRPGAGIVPPSKEIATRFGTRSFLELPDGSKLWLNAGTKVHYTDGFADGKRELTLSGEAFFDIKHDADHPFIVHIGGLDVTVLGTSFNVKAYPGDSVMETTLINGKVVVGLAGKTAGITLQPNEKVIVPLPGTQGESSLAANDQQAAADVKFRRRHVAPDSIYRTLIETSWVDDKLVFRSEQFSEVAAKLERWYNIRFHFENDKYLPMGLTGYFKDQPIENVLHALSLSLGFHYAIEAGVVRVW